MGGCLLIGVCLVIGNSPDILRRVWQAKKQAMACAWPCLAIGQVAVEHMVGSKCVCVCVCPSARVIPGPHKRTPDEFQNLGRQEGQEGKEGQRRGKRDTYTRPRFMNHQQMVIPAGYTGSHSCAYVWHLGVLGGWLYRGVIPRATCVRLYISRRVLFW